MGYNLTAMVNRQLVNGAPYSDIHKMLWEMHQTTGVPAKPPSLPTISRHAKEHLPFKDAAVRAVVEKHAEQRGADIEQGKQNLLTEFAVAETIMKMGHQQMVDGKIELTARDVLAATKMVHDFTRDDEGGLDQAQMIVQVGYIMQAVKEVCSAEQMIRISARVNQLAEDSIEDAILVGDDED
jgi:hypothetical protein